MHPLPEHLLARPIPGIVPVADVRAPLTAVIASLALGGAERIVLEWADEALRRGRVVEVATLHQAGAEWQPPDRLTLLRRGEEPVGEFVAMLAQRWGGTGAPVAAHLVRDAVLREFHRHGLATVPVLHNAQAGWINDPAAWPPAHVPGALACAGAVAEAARAAGCRVPLAVIRHRPALDAQAFDPAARREMRARLGVDDDTLLIGMVGAIKPQKNYPRAVRVLQCLLRRRRAALAILGGVIGAEGFTELQRIAGLAELHDLARQIKLPGFASPAGPWLAAFDVLLNTSDYEGYSIATQEALVAGLPVVATAVSGQVEDPQPGLLLMEPAVGVEQLAAALAALPIRAHLTAPEARMRAPYLWSLALTAYAPSAEPALQTLFVTANLNAGGAQRSLVNLATQIAKRHALAVAVCGETTHGYFPATLRAAEVDFFRPCDSNDVFDQAESLLAFAARRQVRRLCFWNADPKLKLLIAKFAPPPLRLIDVSPGAYAFEEMNATTDFQAAVAFSEPEFYARLDALVLKYGVPAGAPCARAVVIPNGVAASGTPCPMPAQPRFLVSGRIAPSKHLETIIAAFQLLRGEYPQSELHIAGQAEPRQADYLAALVSNVGEGVSFRGALPDLSHMREGWSAQIVIGTHQGSPNAVLEAMAAGVPVIANDSGGTRELVLDGHTGTLLPGQASAQQIAGAMRAVAASPDAAMRLARRARESLSAHGMEIMAARYLALLQAG